jgi:hypothetical protein
MKNGVAGFSLRQHRLEPCATKACTDCLVIWKEIRVYDWN